MHCGYQAGVPGGRGFANLELLTCGFTEFGIKVFAIDAWHFLAKFLPFPRKRFPFLDEPIQNLICPLEGVIPIGVIR